MSEKSVPSRIIGKGTVISQGRGGQSIIMDEIGNIFLTTQNRTGSNQQTLSVSESVSSIIISNGEISPIIETNSPFSTNNFNTINYEQTPIGGVQVIQPVYNVTTQSLNLVVDLPPTSSIPTSSVDTQPTQLITPKEEQILFLPDSETQVFTQITDRNIVGIPITEGDPLKQNLQTLGISTSSDFKNYKSENRCNVISKDKKGFVDVFKLVVNNLEGLYFHPSMLNDGRVEEKYRTTYQSSGETLFGLDRKTGSTDGNAKKFWAKVDSFKPNGNPKWRYNTLGNLNQSQINELYSLGYKVIQPQYNAALNNIPTGLKTIIESDGRLLFSFIYGVWNGSGWYAGYLKLLTEAYNKGITNPDDLLKKHIDDRKNPQRIYPNKPQFALNIQIKSGYDLEKLTGLNCSR
jgi:hypothetical protein